MHQLATWITTQIAALYPGSFALVMATEIISNALFFEGYQGWADTLFAVNLVAYPLLVIFTSCVLSRSQGRCGLISSTPILSFPFLPLWPALTSLASGLICAGSRPSRCSCGYSRGDIAEFEQAAIATFDRASPSVVKVAGLADCVNTDGEDVEVKSGTGILWDAAP